MSEGTDGWAEETIESGEVETVREGEVVSRPWEKFANYLQNRAVVEGEIVAKELTAGQLDAILTATTPEELDAAMEMAELVGLRDFDDGVELQINGFHVAPGNRTEYRNTLGVWAVLEAQYIETGANVNIDTGVERVIGYLRMCEVMGRFPVQVRVSKIGTGGGNEMITLLPLRQRAVQGTTE